MHRGIFCLRRNLFVSSSVGRRQTSRLGRDTNLTTPKRSYTSAKDSTEKSGSRSSLDGNTVDAQIEKSAFLDNALRYEASLMFLNSKIQGLRTAIKGE